MLAALRLRKNTFLNGGLPFGLVRAWIILLSLKASVLVRMWPEATAVDNPLQAGRYARVLQAARWDRRAADAWGASQRIRKFPAVFGIPATRDTRMLGCGAARGFPPIRAYRVSKGHPFPREALAGRCCPSRNAPRLLPICW